MEGQKTKQNRKGGKKRPGGMKHCRCEVQRRNIPVFGSLLNALIYCPLFIFPAISSLCLFAVVRSVLSRTMTFFKIFRHAEDVPKNAGLEGRNK